MIFYISLTLYTVTTSVSCTVSDILSVISRNLKRSRDHEHIHSGCVPYHAYAIVLVNINVRVPNLKCPASLIPKDVTGISNFLKWFA